MAQNFTIKSLNSKNEYKYLGIITSNMIDTMVLYLDPGSGSVLIQTLIGALAGVGITLKIYWWNIKEKFTRNQVQDKSKK